MQNRDRKGASGHLLAHARGFVSGDREDREDIIADSALNKIGGLLLQQLLVSSFEDIELSQ
jgi:hypothetical protein